MTNRWKPLRIAHYNAGNARDPKVEADIRALLALDPDYVTLNEVGDRALLLRRVAGEHDYQLHQGTSRGQAKDAVLVRDDHPIHKAGYRFGAPRARVGLWGAGPGTLDTKWLAWVKTKVYGRRVHVFSWHPHPSVQRGAPTETAQHGRTLRRILWGMLAAAMVTFVNTRRGLRFGGGDTNATLDYVPLRTAIRCAHLQASTAPSHGRRAIDMVLHRKKRNVRVVHVEALDGFSSDHRPVVVDYEILAKAGAR